MSEELSSIGPTETIKFQVIPINDFGGRTGPQFVPAYYPDRFNQSIEKGLRREGQQCRGEDVSIKKFKNTEIHATGVILAENVSDFREIATHDGPADLITPLAPDGGMRVYIKKAEVGEIEGWNPGLSDAVDEQWMFNYTLDFVSTGADEYGNDDTNDIISSKLGTENEIAKIDEEERKLFAGVD